MQRTLVFTREERLLLIEAATLTAHVSPTIQRRLKGLLLQLELTTGSEGCFPRQELIGAKMGASKRTIGKWVEQLRRLNLLSTSPRSTWAGRRQLNYQVDWPALRQFCTAEQLAEIAKKLSGEKLRTAPKNFAAGCEAGSSRDAKPVRRPYSNSSFNSSSAEAGSNFESPAEALQGLVREVASCGVDQALPAVNAALAAGCSADEIRAAIAHYRTLSTGSGVKPGALYVKLRTMSPGEAANRRFPKGTGADPTNAAANRQQAVRQQLQELAQAELAADTAAREQAALQQLETEHGSELDALTKAERLQLIEQHCQERGSIELLQAWQHRPKSPVVRVELLKILSRKESIA